jgi:hypothetical protein
MDQATAGQIDNIIEDIIKQNKIRRFASELGATKDNIERCKDIKQIMTVLQGASVCKFDTLGKTKMTEIYDKINTQTLHWKWGKLSIPQQKDRIKEYLKLTIFDEEKKTQAEKLLFELIDSEKLKKNSIAYDMEKSQITGIFIKEYQDIIQESNSDSDSE